MNFVLPSKSKVGYLDPEIAGEGQKVILSDGEQVPWSPPPTRPVMPDWSQIKSIARYFNRKGFQVYPAWLYHPTEEPRIVKNADEAAELGVCFRKATEDERGRYGMESVWDWQEGSLWRPKPHGAPKFDPMKPGQGKTYIATPQNPAVAQHALLEALIPAVAAAVAQSLKATGPGAPANVEPKEWDEFLQFKAWQKAKDAVNIVADEVEQPTEEQGTDDTPPPPNALNPDQERAVWEAEAERKGIKVDKRWGIDRLKSEVEKKAA